MKYFYLKTFGCIQNQADSNQIIQYLNMIGYTQTLELEKAGLVVINSCVVRQSAENRVYGLIENIRKLNKKDIEIVVTGCLYGWMKNNRNKNRDVKFNFSDIKFVSVETFNIWRDKITKIGNKLVVPISFGCNNFCSYCVVPFSRGREKSRKYEDIINDCNKGLKNNIKEVLLVGQNVNSYGADLVNDTKEFIIGGKKTKPVVVKYMGKKRIATLFPYLLSDVAKMGFKKVSFVSSNPWDFSDELVDVISRNKNIDRLIHLPIQSGDNSILLRMNRDYTTEEYQELVNKLRKKIKGVKISTDIIIGFPQETDKIFEKSFLYYKKIGFDVAYLNKYSPRPGTISDKLYKDDVPQKTKKERWERLEKLINQA